MRKRVFVTNVFGNKNKGDQALFESLVAAVRAQGSEVCWAVATNPDDNARVYPGVTWFGVPWYTPRRGIVAKSVHALWAVGSVPVTALLSVGANSEMIERLREADVIVACPGGYLEDSSRSYISHILQLLLVVFLRKRLILAPQSIGPIRSTFWRSVLTFILERAERVYVREEWSYRFCTETLGIAGDRVSTTVDLAIQVPFAQKEHRFALRDRSETPCLGLTVLDWGFQGRRAAKLRYHDGIVELAHRLHGRGWKIKLLPQTFSRGAPNADLEFAAGILRECPFIASTDQPEHLADFLEEFSDVWVTLGSRLHSCLLSIVAGVPAVALAYLPKSTGTFDLMGVGDFVYRIDDFSAQELERRIEMLAGEGEAAAYFGRINGALMEQGAEFRI
jgi:colanic acid/amylovoran biosynthesis protein